ncbi:hypothetical protein CEXT_155771 [Caerostris extrusa]|uniref:Uncharacterized protein n=1 Tax=Caerostris extrusa TaxID=172846 RepID=A0AAV4T5I7_CAEEX|nr:hypothetical protein CEXT_155771 [Caerostris extrusa]
MNHFVGCVLFLIPSPSDSSSKKFFKVSANVPIFPVGSAILETVICDNVAPKSKKWVNYLQVSDAPMR